MKPYKYILIFILPLIFLSIIGRFFISIPDKKIKDENLKNLNKNPSINNTEAITQDFFLYTIILDTNNTSEGLNFTYHIAKKFRDKGINVHLTRNLDYEIHQEEKFEILYKIKADLYLHLNPVYNYNNLYLLSTLDPNIIYNESINFIPNAIDKSKKSIQVEKNLIDAFSFYFSLKESSIVKEYSKSIDVPIDLPSLSFSFKYTRTKLNSISDLIIKAVIMGLSSKI